jgi:glycine cleavage system H protein
VVGITDHAQHALGDITYVDLPPIGKKVAQGAELAAVESAKAAADVFSPVSGTVAEVNKELDSAPEAVNTDPYGNGWICKLKDVAQGDLNDLLSAAQYRELLKKEEQ